jgi:3-oxoacyl-[acyl-carrier-protein] synthase-1
METSSSRSPCALAGLGIINALGRGRDEIWPRLLAGDTSGISAHDDLVPGRRLLLGEVQRELPRVPGAMRHYDCRNNAMSLAALEPLMDAIEDTRRAVGAARMGVVMGTSTSGVREAETAIRQREKTGELGTSFCYDQLEFGGVAGFVARLLELRGPAYAISTACSSGARALASARSLLALGVCDAVLAGATDTLCGLTTNGFSALQVVSDELTNPCSANRSGVTLGEGSAIFLVTRERAGVQLTGIGESSEAYHMSAPDPEGIGAEAAMRGALADAGCTPDSIAYLNLHGTATPKNDAMECAAVARVFPTPPPSSSTKPMVGHTLGAAGAMEAGFLWLALEASEDSHLDLLPHVYDGVVDDDLDALPLVTAAQRVPLGPTMSNSFGFGGNNCCLILQRDAT